MNCRLLWVLPPIALWFSFDVLACITFCADRKCYSRLAIRCVWYRCPCTWISLSNPCTGLGKCWLRLHFATLYAFNFFSWVLFAVLGECYFTVSGCTFVFPCDWHLSFCRIELQSRVSATSLFLFEVLTCNSFYVRTAQGVSAFSDCTNVFLDVTDTCFPVDSNCRLG